MGVSNKRFILKVYDPTTNELKRSYSDKFFSSVPNFSLELNGGLSAMTLTSSQPIEEYIESTGQFYRIPQAGDLCKIYVYDKEDQDGKIIYSGLYRGTKMVFNGQDRYFQCKFLPNTLQIARRILIDGTDTTVSYTSQEVADIAKDIIDKSDSLVTYDDNSIRNTGLLRSYTYKTEYCLDALKKLTELLPVGWFFYVGADDKLYIKNSEQGSLNFTKWDEFNWDESNWDYDPATEATTSYNLPLSSVISRLDAENDLGELTNRVTFIGGETGGVRLFKQYDDLSSQQIFGVYDKIMTDERVTNETTAEYKSRRMLNTSSVFQNQVSLTIIDSNIEDKGFDIEKLNPGDKVTIRSDLNDSDYTRWDEFNWDGAYWDYEPYALFGIEFIISKIIYKYNSADLVLDYEPEASAQRIEDVNRDLVETKKDTIPDAPT